MKFFIHILRTTVLVLFLLPLKSNGQQVLTAAELKDSIPKIESDSIRMHLRFELVRKYLSDEYDLQAAKSLAKVIERTAKEMKDNYAMTRVKVALGVIADHELDINYALDFMTQARNLSRYHKFTKLELFATHNIAVLLSQNNRSLEAKNLFLETLSMIAEVDQLKSSRLEINCLFNFTTTLVDLGETELALAYCDTLAAAEIAGDNGILHLLGYSLVYSAMKQIQLSQKYVGSFLAKGSNSDMPRRFRAQKLYSENGKLLGSDNYLDSISLGLEIAKSNRVRMGLAESYVFLKDSYQEQGRFDIALQYLKEEIKIAKTNLSGKEKQQFLDQMGAIEAQEIARKTKIQNVKFKNESDRSKSLMQLYIGFTILVIFLGFLVHVYTKKQKLLQNELVAVQDLLQKSNAAHQNSVNYTNRLQKSLLKVPLSLENTQAKLRQDYNWQIENDRFCCDIWVKSQLENVPGAMLVSLAYLHFQEGESLFDSAKFEEILIYARALFEGTIAKHYDEGFSYMLIAQYKNENKTKRFIFPEPKNEPTGKTTHPRLAENQTAREASA